MKIWFRRPLMGRFAGIGRPYSAADVERLRGSFPIAYTLAERGANRLWELLHDEPLVNALGAVTGNQAMQMVARRPEGDLPLRLAGRGRQQHRRRDVSRPEPLSGQRRARAVPPHQPHPAARRPDRARRGRRQARLVRCPIVADAEAGFGGPLNSFEIMKAFIEAGAAGVHFEDQLASEKKCGHMGGKVLIPTAAHDPQPDRRAPGGRRLRRADPGRRPHRRRDRPS